MNWRSFDLNLLVVFDAVMQDRNVTRAATRIGMSQPAMSHALSRLRRILKDDLFIRAPEGMDPTARAERLATPVHQALQGLRLTLEDADLFVPTEVERSFAIALNTSTAFDLVAPLAAIAAAEAPGVVLHLSPAVRWIFPIVLTVVNSTSPSALRRPPVSGLRICACSRTGSSQSCAATTLPLGQTARYGWKHSRRYRTL
jgi:regulatory helix-turn-helix LysR family protein